MKYLKNERGQLLILTPILIVILLSTCGLVYDIGNLLYQKQIIQDAADLAALAAVQETTKDNPGAVISTAKNFANKNGISSSEITVSYPYNGDSLKVGLVVKRNVSFVFLPIVGIDTKTITTTAAAEATVKYEEEVSDSALDYCIFSGSNAVDLAIKGNGSVVNGNVHGNKKITVSGSGHTINGNISSVDGITLATTTVNGIVTNKTSAVPMPDLLFEQYAAKATTIYNSDVILNDITLNGIVLCNGNLKLNGGRIKGNGILLARGSVDIPTSGITYDSSNDLLAIYSLVNITLSAANANINGILYAPNGQIRINGSKNTVYGALIANSIVWTSNGFTVNANYDMRVPQALTIKKPAYMLIQ